MIDKIKKAIEKPLGDKNFKLIEVAYLKEGKNNFLKITIDKEDSINVDDCVVATKIISAILDKNEFIKEQYILDVSSVERRGN